MAAACDDLHTIVDAWVSNDATLNFVLGCNSSNFWM